MRAALTAWLSIAALAGAQGPTDLSEVIAQPLDAEFTEAGGASFLNGQFDAHQYAVWLAGTGSDIGPYEEWFRSNGFVRGYSRTWSEPVHVEVGVGESRVQYLTETIEEYRNSEGSGARQDGTRSSVRTESGFEKDIETTIPGAWAAVIDAGYSIQYEVSFRKGNDVYFVSMDSAVNDMTDKLLQQATSQFEKAPAATVIPKGSQTTGAPSFPPAMANHTLLIAGGVLIGGVVAVTVVVFIFLIAYGPASRQRRGLPPPGGYLSPDGAYWWDGASWQPTNPGSTGPP